MHPIEICRDGIVTSRAPGHHRRARLSNLHHPAPVGEESLTSSASVSPARLEQRSPFSTIQDPEEMFGHDLQAQAVDIPSGMSLMRYKLHALTAQSSHIFTLQLSGCKMNLSSPSLQHFLRGRYFYTIHALKSLDPCAVLCGLKRELISRFESLWADCGPKSTVAAR